MSRSSPEILSRLLIVSALTFGGCQSGEIERQTTLLPKATRIPPITFTPWPTFTATPELPTATPEITKFVLEKEMGLPEIISRFPVFDEKDPYYLWYRWNGGGKLFEPLAIPNGTVLLVPNPDQEPPLFPPLPEITVPPEKWEEELAVQTTSLKGSSVNRMQNIRTATNKLNGTIVEPLRLFSMIEAIGPFTEQEGYVMGWGYTPAGEVPMFAGGVCQLPSTLFKPAAEAGMLIIVRYAHSYYGPNYEAWDATVSEELDFTFRNLYRYPVQIRAQVNEEKESLTIGIWSPFGSAYDRVQLETLYNRKNPDGSRDAAVRQKVSWVGRERERIYYSHYTPKPAAPTS